MSDMMFFEEVVIFVWDVDKGTVENTFKQFILKTEVMRL